MNAKEFAVALRTVKVVFCFVAITGDDGVYVEVSKVAIKRAVGDTLAAGHNIRAVVRANEPDALYVS